MSSRAVSLFPTPELPIMRMPRPKTSTKTPCKEILGAKVFDRIRKRRKASSFEERVEVKIGQLCLSLISKNSFGGFKSFENKQQGILKENIFSIVDRSFFSVRVAR